jgi:hypothetical protein
MRTALLVLAPDSAPGFSTAALLAQLRWSRGVREASTAPAQVSERRWRELFQPPSEDVAFKAGPLPTTSKPSR